LAIPFDRSVFVNCPFDDDFAPILQAIAFCITDLGFIPRLAPENSDNATHRLDRIVHLIHSSRYGIHDLSRCKSAAADEYARMNMPFELGMDYATRFGADPDHQSKSILVLEHSRYDYQKSLSDISGWDISAHNGDHIAAVRIVSAWLIRQSGIARVGPSRIMGNYAAFQEWYWERELSQGASEDDIKAYPTIEMVDAMRDWVNMGRPT